VADQNGQIHSQVAELLSAYIDDEMTADERALVDAHLATCVMCVQDLATLRQTVALLGQLPQVAAPRPFTLRESDVRPVRGPSRLAWWQLPWARGLVGAAAVLVCVLVVGGVVLLGRGGMVGAPAAPAPVAMQQANVPPAPANEKVVAETAVVDVEEGQELRGAAVPAAESYSTPVEATAEVEMMLEAPAEAAPLEEKAAADEGEILMTTEPLRAAAGAVPSAMPTPAPLGTATPTPVLLEVEDLNLEIEPGIIRVGGRVPLPEGRKLLVVLWRDGQPIEWGTLESQRLVVEADGQFHLVLVAQANIPDEDLFAAAPAEYEIRMHPVDPPVPVENRIPFDTYGPPLPEPTSTP
jgi:hypothetical protein